MFPFARLFASPRPLIGMVHLLPLPGSPRWGGSMDAVFERARRDARLLAEGGLHGLIVENYGDLPFSPTRVEAVTVAAMALAIRAVQEAAPDLPVGINVLRADVRSALALAAVTSAPFVRTNLLAGALVADQGILQSDAYLALRERAALGAPVSILADVLSKHAIPLGEITLEQAARSTAYRSLADAIIITGEETGAPTSADDLRRARAAVPDRPILIGSGLKESNVRILLPLSDGAVVGSALKMDGVAENPVDPDRVRRIIALVRKL